jgi:predicted nuclease of predicted toxin-antitoxin system
VKFLIDNALPPRLADLLRASGYDAVHVRAYEMQEATDRDILARARDEDRIVVSAESDFSTILASHEADRRPSFSFGGPMCAWLATTLTYCFPHYRFWIPS